MKNQDILDLWQEKFANCLAKEFENSEYFKVHHLLVLTYMIQIDGYSLEYFPEAKKLLRDFLFENITPSDFRQKFNQIQKTNKLKISKEENQRDIYKFCWNKTILSVGTSNPEEYCFDIKKWALDVLGIIETENDL